MPRPTQRGFTLLEVLVAFTVAALLLSVILRAFSSGLIGLARTEQLVMAAWVAESRLAELALEVEIQPGRLEGEDESGYRWVVEVVPLDWEYSSPLLEVGLQLQRVRVEVFWGEGLRQRSFILQTMKTVQVAE